MRKKFYLLGAMLLCFVLLCGCDVYAGKRPEANPNERWVCEDPQMYFTWTDDVGCHWGEITIDGITTKVEVLFDYGSGVIIIQFGATIISSDTKLFQGDCKFGKDELVVTVEEDYANLFNGDLPSFVFKRQANGSPA